MNTNHEILTANWREGVGRYCMGNTRLVFAASAALAAVVLKKMGRQQPISIHFFGPPASGKTLILQVASSVWAHGDSSLFTVMDDRLGRVDRQTTMVLTAGDVVVYAPKECALAGVVCVTRGVARRLHGAGSAREFVDNLSTASRMDGFAWTRAAARQRCVGRVFGDVLDERKVEWPGRVLDIMASIPVEMGLGFATVAAAGELATHYGLTGWAKGEAVAAAMSCALPLDGAGCES